jgi:hypothetical protein
VYECTKCGLVSDGIFSGLCNTCAERLIDEDIADRYLRGEFDVWDDELADHTVEEEECTCGCMDLDPPGRIPVMGLSF